jgi:polyhydroxybutyrate depolymerase
MMRLFSKQVLRFHANSSDQTVQYRSTRPTTCVTLCRVTAWVLLLLFGSSSAIPAAARSAAAREPGSEPESEPAKPLGPGDHRRTLKSGQLERSYLVHLPANYQPGKATPVVLALHGAAMNGAMMEQFCGMNDCSDKNGFIVVYPNGTGVGPLLTWNAGAFSGRSAEGMPDDVQFIRQLLDDLATVATVDTKRIFACGLSNGGMMCYRLAAELSERIAAVAPVAGTLLLPECKPTRPVPLLHIHGLKDRIVKYEAPQGRGAALMRLRGVEDSVQTWVKLNGCSSEPRSETISKPDDEMKVERRTYGAGKGGAEVVLIVIDEGGHTWPGRPAPVGFIGKSAMNISANDLIWEFFQRHPMK